MQMPEIRRWIRPWGACVLAGMLVLGCSGSDDDNENFNYNNNNVNENTNVAQCGNGVVEVGEVCDASNLDGRDCASEGYTAGTLICGGDCTFDLSGCTTCGNDICESGEETTCLPDCTVCGNGLCEAGEVTSCLQDCLTMAPVAAGSAHSCAIRADATVRCWGNNGYGQLGDGTAVTRLAPTPVIGLTEVVDVAAGEYHSCAVRSDHTVWCWGHNDDGRLGDATNTGSATPVQVSGMTDAMDVEVDHNHSCAIRADATVWCWGLGEDGQLGNGAWMNSNVPVQVSGLAGAVSLTVGDYHSCAALADGTAWCWGSNIYLGLGNGEDFATTSGVNTPVQVVGLTDVVQVTGGNFQSCARLASGEVWCWGVNVTGTLGDGSYASSAVPVRALVMDDAVDISAGGYHVCAARANGEVWCWGNNEDGELGNGTWAWSPVAVQATGVAGATYVAGGSAHSCAYLSDGSVSCWGKNWDGQLGQNTQVDRGSAVRVQAQLTGDASYVALGMDHGCVILTDGTLWCWGRGWNWDSDWQSWHGGQLGVGGIGGQPVPTQVPGLTNVTSVAPFGEHTCAVAGGEVWCWGSNSHGQLGNPTTLTDSDTPVQVQGLPASALNVTSGDSFSCAELSNTTIYCWGYGQDGQLGNGAFADSAVPVQAGTGGGTPVAGDEHVCAAYDFELHCWGSNWAGQLGAGDYTYRASRYVVDGGVTLLAVGSHHTCYRQVNIVKCMGWNYYGQAGQPLSTADVPTPTQVPDLWDEYSLHAGHSHTCTVTSDGFVQCWGSGTDGQLGNGVFADSLTPVTVPGLNNPIGMDGGDGYTCAIQNDATLWCWGDASYGKLGTLVHWHESLPGAVSF